MRQVGLLFICEALTRTSSMMVLMSMALTGRRLAPDPSLATLPLALVPVAMTLTTIPAAQMMRRFGRRAGFRLAALIGVVGAATCVLAVRWEMFAVLCLGGFLIGSGNGFATAREDLVMGVAAPVRGSKPVDIGSECHAVEFGSGIVFTESGVDQEVRACDGRANDLGSLDRSVEVAADQHRTIKFVRVGETVVETRCLLSSEVGKAAAGAVAADDAVDGDLRLSVPDQHHPCRSVCHRSIIAVICPNAALRSFVCRSFVLAPTVSGQLAARAKILRRHRARKPFVQISLVPYGVPYSRAGGP